ncbi:ImuA family protein [Chitinophaga niabensis]|uniref:Protein ImuA n=1 Tax=Chitinophaga niabensis TaxID=536979 RepID=A0A1N6E414_9BACT|nr:Error-prone repair protein ImuA [Chitinophaga niabensis]SIN77754.1 protein ImuA [Chitinophaga niabensis]
MSGKKEVIEKLQREILSLQGHKSLDSSEDPLGLGPLEASFPGGVFPRAAVHEFISNSPTRAATAGFVSAILANLLKNGSVCLWIGVDRTVFPPALKAFGVEPERVIFIDLKKTKDVLWVMEEALKCEGLAAVIAEAPDVDFNASRRLQLAVENSKVTGFLLRNDPKSITATACTARWKLSFLPSELANRMPGVGHPRWAVELLKVRNGTTGYWELECMDGQFNPIAGKAAAAINEKLRKIG